MGIYHTFIHSINIYSLCASLHSKYLGTSVNKIDSHPWEIYILARCESRGQLQYLILRNLKENTEKTKGFSQIGSSQTCTQAERRSRANALCSEHIWYIQNKRGGRNREIVKNKNGRWGQIVYPVRKCKNYTGIQLSIEASVGLEKQGNGI